MHEKLNTNKRIANSTNNCWSEFTMQNKDLVLGWVQYPVGTDIDSEWYL